MTVLRLLMVMEREEEIEKEKVKKGTIKKKCKKFTISFINKVSCRENLPFQIMFMNSFTWKNGSLRQRSEDQPDCCKLMQPL